MNRAAGEGELHRRHLEELVICEKNRSPIRGVSGKDGGSCLTKPVGEIIIRAIFELAIRPVNIGHGMKEEQH